MWTPYQTRNHRHQCDTNQLNERQQMYSHRDYLRAVLESGMKQSSLEWKRRHHLRTV